MPLPITEKTGGMLLNANVNWRPSGECTTLVRVREQEKVSRHCKASAGDGIGRYLLNHKILILLSFSPEGISKRISKPIQIIPFYFPLNS